MSEKKTKTAAKAETAGATVTVTVGRQALQHDGQDYAPGDQFETTAERAAALGDQVQVTSGPTEE